MGLRHQRVQRLRRLLRQRSVRRADRAFVVEGTRVLEVALQEHAALEAAYFAPEALTDTHVARLLEALQTAGVRTFSLAAGVMERVADTATPQPLCAIATFLDVTLAEAAGYGEVLVCAEVRDPGNLGSTLRSADAAGLGAVILAGGTVDLYNPKTVRASAGAIFRVPVAQIDQTSTVLTALRERHHRLVGTSSFASADYAAADLAAPIALVLGNEANGLSPAELEEMDELVAIPMSEGAESLNVAMAATVLCFELARRRRAHA